MENGIVDQVMKRCYKQRLDRDNPYPEPESEEKRLQDNENFLKLGWECVACSNRTKIGSAIGNITHISVYGIYTTFCHPCLFKFKRELYEDYPDAYFMVSSENGWDRPLDLK